MAHTRQLKGTVDLDVFGTMIDKFSGNRLGHFNYAKQRSVNSTEWINVISRSFESSNAVSYFHFLEGCNNVNIISTKNIFHDDVVKDIIITFKPFDGTLSSYIKNNLSSLATKRDICQDCHRFKHAARDFTQKMIGLLKGTLQGLTCIHFQLECHGALNIEEVYVVMEKISELGEDCPIVKLMFLNFVNGIEVNIRSIQDDLKSFAHLIDTMCDMFGFLDVEIVEIKDLVSKILSGQLESAMEIVGQPMFWDVDTEIMIWKKMVEVTHSIKDLSDFGTALPTGWPTEFKYIIDAIDEKYKKQYNDTNKDFLAFGRHIVLHLEREGENSVKTILIDHGTAIRRLKGLYGMVFVDMLKYLRDIIPIKGTRPLVCRQPQEPGFSTKEEQGVIILGF